MVLLLRIAETRAGADRLIEYGLLEKLTDCQYLDQLPSAEGHQVGLFSVNSNEKFCSVTNSAFELISLIISHYSSDKIIVTKKVTNS